jgi:hypothetical protein
VGKEKVQRKGVQRKGVQRKGDTHHYARKVSIQHFQKRSLKKTGWDHPTAMCKTRKLLPIDRKSAATINFSLLSPGRADGSGESLEKQAFFGGQGCRIAL